VGGLRGGVGVAVSLVDDSKNSLTFFLFVIYYVECGIGPRQSEINNERKRSEIKDQTTPAIIIIISPTTINHEHHHHEKCRR